MELYDYLRAVRKRWRVIVVSIVVVLGLAALVTALTPETYEARTRLFVSTAAGQDVSALLQGSSFTENRVKSYADVINSPRVLAPVVKQLGLEVRPGELAQQVTATVPPETVLIDVAVRDHSAEQAAEIADAVGREFSKTVAELETVKAGQESPVKVSIIAQPSVPAAPVSPQPARNLALGLISGLLVGAGAAMVRETLDTRIRGEADCERVGDAAVIGGVAFDSEAPKHPLVIQTDPHSGRAEAFRSLRTNLQYIDAASHPRSIVFTSSVPNEGKTTTAANLATTLAASGAEVCIVEADLRRPRLLSYMGLEGGVGLTTVLIGQAQLNEVLQDFAGMSVLGAGHVPPNPSELLGSTAMRETLRELEQRFDMVIIDAPPLLPVTDAAVLSTIADGTVVVVGVGSTKREQLAASLSALEHVGANVLGLVLNKLPTKGPDAYNYTYYREGYRPLGARKRAKAEKREETEPVHR